MKDTDYEAAYDEGYNAGFIEGEARTEEFEVEEALARYVYLQNGGEWHRETTGDLYVQGFKDALKTLGVLK